MPLPKYPRQKWRPDAEFIEKVEKYRVTLIKELEKLVQDEHVCMDKCTLVDLCANEDEDCPAFIKLKELLESLKGE